MSHFNTTEGARPKYNLFVIPGYDDYYIDIMGSVWSSKRGSIRPMKIKVKRNGYLEVCLWHDRQKTYHYVHALVLTVFHGERPTGFVACHGPDDTKSNVAVGNLRWDTVKANAADFVASGRASGRMNGPKLNPMSVKAIRRAHRQGSSIQALADRHHVSTHCIRRVVNGQAWKHVR